VQNASCLVILVCPPRKTMADGEIHEPAVNLDESLSKARELVSAIHDLHSLHEDAHTRAEREAAQHQKTISKIKAVEGEHARARDAHERETKEHLTTKEKLANEEKSHAKSREALQASKDEFASMRLQMEALKVELEAQRKAFVVNVNWAARCTELKAKYDKHKEDHERLLDQHSQSTASWGAKERELLANKDELSSEIQTKLAQLDEYTERDMRDAVAGKASRQKAMSVLQRSFHQEEQGALQSAFMGWASLSKEERQSRLAKDKAMKKAARTIANDGTALQAQAFYSWTAEFENVKRAQMVAASKRLQEAQANSGEGALRSRQRILKELQKQYAGQDKSLVKDCFSGWMTGRAMRKKKDQGNQKALRLMANSDRALTAEIFKIWNDCAENVRSTKQAKDAGKQRALRLIANSDGAVKAEIMQIWTGIIAKIRAKRKGKEAGTAKAMRMIANSDNTLLNVCYDSWARVRHDHVKKDQASKKALRMISNSSESLKVSCFQGWAKIFSSTKQKKNSNAKAVRMIANSNEAITSTVLRTWHEFIKKNKDRNRKLRAVQKTIGGSEQGIKMLTLTAWQEWAQKEGRGKRAKRRAMKSAIKSITGMQDILMMQVFLSWGRMCYGSQGLSDQKRKINELVAELDDSRRKARVIGDELDKLGMFLTTRTPKKQTPMTLPKASKSPEGVLPRIEAGSRPRSAARSAGSAKAPSPDDGQV